MKAKQQQFARPTTARPLSLRGLHALAVALAIVCGGVGAAYAASTRYVATTGNDAANTCLVSGSPCLTINHAIAVSGSGDTINVAAGTYRQDVVVSQSVTLAGAGAGSSMIQPGTSNPNCGGSLCGTNIVLIQANNVTIHDFTLDGNNPTITSGITVGGSDIDAGNGIITDYNSGTYTNLVVYNATIQNVFLNGIEVANQNDGDPFTFNLHDLTVTNVQGDAASSTGLFNYEGSGTFQNNQISQTITAISSNYSTGTQYLTNTVTTSLYGIHSDNAGAADLLQGNIVSACVQDGFAVWVYDPGVAPTINNNTVTGCAVGLAALGQAAAVTAAFTNNIVDGTGALHSVNDGITDVVGAYVTTSLLSFGSSDVSASFTGNLLENNQSGFFLQQESGFTLTATLSCNGIHRNKIGVNSQAAGVTAHNNSITGSTTSGADGTAISPASSMNFQTNWWGCAAGPGNVGCDSVTANVDASSFLTNLPVCSPLCGTNADCTDPNQCTTDTCVANHCSNPNAPSGTSCSDGNVCTQPDTCNNSGVCTAGATATLCQQPPCTGPAPYTFTTDPGNTGATSGHRLTTAVTAPTCGTVVISESTDTATPPAGFTYLNDQDLINISFSPALTASTPLTIVLQLYSGDLAPAYSPLATELFMNGTRVPFCNAPSTSAVPDPCVAKKIVLSSGNLETTVMTSTGATFNFGVPEGVSLDLGLPLRGVGLAGGTACVTSSLASRGFLLKTAADLIDFDPTIFSVASCAINPTIAGSPYNKTLTSGTAGSGLYNASVSGGTAIIPDGLMYTCNMNIATGTTLGRYALSNTASGVDNSNQPLTPFNGTAQVLVTSCVGDCDGNNVVSINEVVKAINIHLGRPLCSPSDANLSCPVADSDHNGLVGINEVVQAINRHIAGCP